MSQNPFDLLADLRERSRARKTPADAGVPMTLGETAADAIASLVGSWPFILIQSALLVGWVIFNLVSPGRVDPYPFILLNLLLSTQAAYTAPVIMMSQNRQAEIDRRRSIADYEINRKAELEIETLHQKIDLLREQEIAALSASVARLTRLLEGPDRSSNGQES